MSSSTVPGVPGAKPSTVLGSSAVMAAGTVVSRVSGFVRAALLAAALGNLLHAELFNIANTIPNTLYILLAGGVFNAVLVPQLVRAMKNDADGGEAYTARVVTLAGLFLAGVTAVLVVAAPLVMRLYLGEAYFTPALNDQRASVIAFARYCLPQVFFYGMFVLVGQVLNARGRFGPMMWAPIANNVVSVAVIVVYLILYGPASGAELRGGYGSGQELLLGLGSTLGIAVQLAILVPYLRAAGFRYRPRFDFRGSGLGHTLRLGTWTVLFVIVNQVSYTVVVRVASAGAADAGTGYTVYSGAFLLVMAAHGISTVSLATATLPRISAFAAAGDLARVGREVGSTLRTALALVVPFALLLPVVALPLADLVFGYAAASDSFDLYAPSLALFAPGLVFFTVHYLVLRGFYALERTRLVFWVQCVIAAVNIVLAVVLTGLTSARATAPGLVVAYAGAYLVGATLSYSLLRRTVGGLQTRRTLRFLVRLLLAAGTAALVAWGVRTGIDALWSPSSGAAGKAHALVTGGAAGLVDLAVLLVLARVLRVTEVTEVVDLVTARLPARRSARR